MSSVPLHQTSGQGKGVITDEERQIGWHDAWVCVWVFCCFEVGIDDDDVKLNDELE